VFASTCLLLSTPSLFVLMTTIQHSPGYQMQPAYSPQYAPPQMQYAPPMSPMMMMTVATPTREAPQPWRSGFCSCMDDPASCCMAFCFPCVLYGQNAEKIDGSGCFCNCCLYACCMACYGCQCLVHAGKRTGLRIKYNLRPDPCDDCCVAWCCSCCALSQEARELLARANDAAPSPQVMMMMSPSAGQSPSGPTTINVHQLQQPPTYLTRGGEAYGIPNQQLPGATPPNYSGTNGSPTDPMKQPGYMGANGTSPAFSEYSPPGEAYRINGEYTGQNGSASPLGSTQVLKSL